MFDGKKWWRDNKGYYRRQGLILHREIWKKFKGSIPKNYHIHHIDKNKDNNDISNLQCLTASEHLRLHAKGAEAKEWARKLCERIRPLTKIWHKSEKGREWHRKHAQQFNFGNWEPKSFTCLECHTNFKSSKLSNTKFCSNACKSKFRRKSKVDNITLICIICSSPFDRNKYGKSQCCSRKCAGQMRKNKKHSISSQ